MTRSGKMYQDNEVVGVAKQNNLAKCSSTRQKLQNGKGYAEAPEILPALGLFIFNKKSVTTLEVNRSLVR